MKATARKPSQGVEFKPQPGTTTLFDIFEKHQAKTKDDIKVMIDVMTFLLSKRVRFKGAYDGAQLVIV